MIHTAPNLNQMVPSPGNSTTETLAADATYTGTWEKPIRPDAQLWVLAEKAATLFIEFSPDGGTTTDQFPFGGVAMTAGVPYYDHVVVGGQSFRIRVTDTSSSTNDLITLVTYGNYQRPSSIISTGMSSIQAATNTKTVMFGVQADGTTYVEAQMSSDKELFTTSSESDTNVRAVMTRNGISSTAYSILVDLSDTTNFPHDNTSRIDISYVGIVIDPATNSVGALKVGVITDIDGTDADISYLHGVPFGKSPIRINDVENFSPSQLKMGVTNNAIDFAITDDSETTTSVNTGVSLNSPRGASTVTPAIGDVIVKYLHTSGSAWDSLVECFYHSH